MAKPFRIEGKSGWWVRYTDLFRGEVRVALEVALEDELREMVGAKKWERQAQRVDSRNGTYLRRLITTMGAIDLEVPRAREGGSCGAAVIGRYERRSAEIDDAMVSAYVHGASTRDIGYVTEALMGEHVSKSTVTRVAKTLGTKVEELRKAPIEGPIPYLFLDATFVDARWAREVENVSALVAYGVGLGGHRELLAVAIGAGLGRRDGRACGGHRRQRAARRGDWAGRGAGRGSAAWPLPCAGLTSTSDGGVVTTPYLGSGTFPAGARARLPAWRNALRCAPPPWTGDEHPRRRVLPRRHPAALIATARIT
jgi:hypothetical protein